MPESPAVPRPRVEPTTPSVRLPSIHDNYQFLEKLGEGGFATVSSAYRKGEVAVLKMAR